MDTPARKKETEFRIDILALDPITSFSALRSFPRAISEIPVKENFLLISIIIPIRT
jgi:hypothetical protein